MLCLRENTFDFVLEDPLWKNLMYALGKSKAQLDSIRFDVVIPDSEMDKGS